MATWTVTTTADDGSFDTNTRTGTLRGIIGAAASGDTIIFDDSLEDSQTGVITIYLESQLSMPAMDLTIDGGGHSGNGETLATRVILDGQNATNALQTTNGANVILNDITFYNTTRTSGAGSVLRASTGGQVYTLNYCVVDTTNSAALYLLGTTDTTFNNCVFKNCKSKGQSGVLYTFASPTVTFNNCVFRDNESSSPGGATAYIYGSGTTAFNSCDVGTTVSDWNIYANAGGNSLKFNNTNVIDKVRLGPFSVSLEGKLTADVLSISNDATVTFSGIDAILAVTTTATIGSATFTAAENSTGYAAFPAGTNISAATFSGVKTATYGSVTSINATIDANVATFTIQAASTGYLIEGSTDGVTWETITPTDGKATLTSAKAYQFRAFAGAFVYSPVIPRTYYYTGGTADGDFSVAADWALDKEKTIVCSDAPTIKDGVFYCVEVE